jgi:hypothetical protein
MKKRDSAMRSDFSEGFFFMMQQYMASVGAKYLLTPTSF